MLQAVREHGAWEAWLEFVLEGVAATAILAFDAANRIIALFKHDRERIGDANERAGSALRIHELFQTNPFMTSPFLAERTGFSSPTVNAALADIVRLGILEEITGSLRGRVYAYQGYLAILSEGTESPPLR